MRILNMQDYKRTNYSSIQHIVIVILCFAVL